MKEYQAIFKMVMIPPGPGEDPRYVLLFRKPRKWVFVNDWKFTIPGHSNTCLISSLGLNYQGEKTMIKAIEVVLKHLALGSPAATRNKLIDVEMWDSIKSLEHSLQALKEQEKDSG